MVKHNFINPSNKRQPIVNTLKQNQLNDTTQLNNKHTLHQQQPHSLKSNKRIQKKSLLLAKLQADKQAQIEHKKLLKKQNKQRLSVNVLKESLLEDVIKADNDTRNNNNTIQQLQQQSNNNNKQRVKQLLNSDKVRKEILISETNNLNNIFNTVNSNITSTQQLIADKIKQQLEQQRLQHEQYKQSKQNINGSNVSNKQSNKTNNNKPINNVKQTTSKTSSTIKSASNQQHKLQSNSNKFSKKRKSK